MQDQVKFADPAEVMAWLKSGEAVVVDVREAPEYAAGHIPGVLLNSLSAFDPAKIPELAGKKLVFHCQAGNRCGPASARMIEAGHGGVVYRLKGGFLGWKAAGGPVEA